MRRKVSETISQAKQFIHTHDNNQQTNTIKRFIRL